MAQLVGEGGMAAGYQGAWAVAAGTVALRRGDVATAQDLVDLARAASVQDAAGLFRSELLAARVLLMKGSPEAGEVVVNLRRIARLQGSALLQSIAALLDGLVHGPTADRAVTQVLPGKEHILSLLADEVVGRLSHLSEASLERVRREAALRPERWASALRLHLSDGEPVARLLADVGFDEDRVLLREMASTQRWLRPIAGAMTRRLAPVVLIRDLGAVRVYLGERPLDRNMRRKVIGLLCFVSSRPGMAATKDEVLEALWPDLGPDTAGNSLHQTIYFLRRLLEADFKEGTSAGYVHFDGEVLALDEGLIRTDSRECWRLIDEARTGDELALDRLVRLYRGTFALDFAYEDWATTYRENLHAAVLSSVEVGVRNAVLGGDLERGIRLAQDLLAVDPTADAVELELLRAYKAGGRHAAAAEQYAHYASYIRGELGADPPSFGDI
jgi:DNA-binding SARP family transcriptional activator